MHYIKMVGKIHSLILYFPEASFAFSNFLANLLLTFSHRDIVAFASSSSFRSAAFSSSSDDVLLLGGPELIAKKPSSSSFSSSFWADISVSTELLVPVMDEILGLFWLVWSPIAPTSSHRCTTFVFLFEVKMGTTSPMGLSFGKRCSGRKRSRTSVPDPAPRPREGVVELRPNGPDAEAA